MARFNPTTRQSTVTHTHEGGRAFSLDPATDLVTKVSTSTLNPKFYERNTDAFIEEVKELINKLDPVFVAKLALYARSKMNMRTIPIVLLVELAKVHSGDDLLRRAVRNVIQRPDEIKEILAYYVQANNRMKYKDGQVKKLYGISNQMKKGIADSFHKFDEYQFAKWQGNSQEIKLRDALFITHPKPRSEAEKELFDKIAQESLKTPETWETKLSQAGQEKRSKKEEWEDLIERDKLPYMATLRNLRNFIKEDVSKEHIQKVADKIADPEKVKYSRQLPFRFLSAYKSLIFKETDLSGWNILSATKRVVDRGVKVSNNEAILLRALETAAYYSAQNIPMFGEDHVLMACDISGSMHQAVSEKSTVSLFDVGLILANLMHTKCKYVTTGIFGTRWEPMALGSDRALENTVKMYSQSNKVGTGTNGHLVLDWAYKQGFAYDKVMFFTDGQFHHSIESTQKKWRDYKKISPNAKLYIFDLNGYGRIPFDSRDNDVTVISGWSEKIFDVLEDLENPNSLIEEVKKMELK